MTEEHKLPEFEKLLQAFAKACAFGDQQARVDAGEALRTYVAEAVAQLVAAEAVRTALAQQEGKPVAWGQLGLLNGHSYLRMIYDRVPYPPAADVVRNLNLVPLYAALPQAPEEADRRDAARYRWLREGRMEFGDNRGGPSGRGWWIIDFTPEEADYTIDAAMAARTTSEERSDG